MKKTSKKIAILALTIILIIAIMSFAGCKSTQTNFDVQKTDSDSGESIMTTMGLLASEYANRTMASEGEYIFAKYLSQVMQGYGYTSEYSADEILGLEEFKVSLTRYDGTNVQEAKAYNVIFEKKSQNSKGNIILACQYDNLYSETSNGTEWKADGSYESGMSIAVLLRLAELLKDKTLDYDITFAFLTGGSYGWLGASQYLSGFDSEKINNTKLFINLSMLGGGDNLYLYSSETSTSYDNYLRAVSSGLTSNPKDKNVSYFILESDSLYPYTHIGMIGNHYYFINKGIPTANFMSLNWLLKDNPMMTEMDGKANIYHTKDDTLQKMIERKGEDAIKTMGDNVVDSIMSALDSNNRENLDNVLALAKSEMVNENTQNVTVANILNIVLKVLAVGAILAVSWSVRSYVQKNKDKLMPKKEENTEPDIEPFDMENFDKIVDEHTKEKPKTKEEDDDPFV